MKWLSKLFSGKKVPESNAHISAENPEEEAPSNQAADELKDPSILVSDSPAREDVFNRKPFAKRLADMIATHTDPQSMVFGLYGEWGSGKTTILKLTDEILKENYGDKVVSFWFNPWRFHDEARLLSAFMQRLTDVLGKSTLTGGKRFAQFVKEKLAPVIPDVEVPGGAKVNFSGAIERYADNLLKADLESIRDRVGDFLVKSKARVVIFMDDIDRLDNTEIQTVFRLVKLTADFNNTTYVLALDDVLAAQALSPRYSPGTERSVGSSFLEKIVQVPLRVPNIPRRRLVTYCFREVDRVLSNLGIQLSDEEGAWFGTYFDQGCGSRVTTPRAAKRFANVLAFTLPVVEGEVNLPDFMLIEALHMFHPEIYKLIRNYPEVALGIPRSGLIIPEERKKAASEAVKALLLQLPSQERDGVQSLLRELFPRMEGLSRSASYRSEWEAKWARQRRVASSRFFDRYFAYAVGNDEVSEREVMEVADIVALEDINLVGNAITRLITERDQEEGLFAIERVSQLLKDQPARLLAYVLAQQGSALHDRGLYGIGLSPRRAAMRIIVSLLGKMTDLDARMEAAKAILQDADPLTFASDILSWIDDDRSVDETSGEKLFNEETLTVLRGIVASRISSYGIRAILDACDTDDSRFLIWGWKRLGNTSALSSELGELVTSDGSYAVRLVKSLVPVATSLNTGTKRKEDFTHEHYTTLSELIDPEVVYSALQQQFGEGIENPSYDRSDSDVDRRLARQFAYVHLHPKVSKDADDSLADDSDNNE